MQKGLVGVVPFYGQPPPGDNPIGGKGSHRFAMACEPELTLGPVLCGRPGPRWPEVWQSLPQVGKAIPLPPKQNLCRFAFCH